MFPTFYIALFATYHFAPWLFSARFDWIRNFGYLLCAILVAGYTWRHTASQGLAISIGVGAIVTGAIGFLAGFVGPIILDPMSPQGPLLGIFITGPLGVLAGAVGGAIYWSLRRWSVRRKRIAENLPDGSRAG
jgi:hypothetical protein